MYFWKYCIFWRYYKFDFFFFFLVKYLHSLHGSNHFCTFYSLPPQLVCLLFIPESLHWSSLVLVFTFSLPLIFFILFFIPFLFLCFQKHFFFSHLARTLPWACALLCWGFYYFYLNSKNINHTKAYCLVKRSSESEAQNNIQYSLVQFGCISDMNNIAFPG